MDVTLIFLPALAMAMLTIAVMLRMLAIRVGEMKRERIHPQAVATSAQATARFGDTRAADNFRNLFELPVLFYVALLFAAQMGQVTTTMLTLAWLFVALRTAHSYIHCTYNKVMHRFKVYLASGVVLLSLWAYLAVCLFW
ncbi:MAG: MAPEG family protein [Lysobacter sp.]|nr:MAPEG family protein [Lysobacter sp.]